MLRIGLVINKEKPKAVEVANEIITWAEQKGLEILLPEEMASCLQDALKGERKMPLDYALVLGGDGTLLNTARKLAPFGIPILGINLGHLGFLTEIELPNLDEGLLALTKGELLIEERLMLSAEIKQGPVKLDRFYALNDVVISKGSFSRMIRLAIKVSGEYVETYPADGLIISSPTGSTAYCLSAGGPIVSPKIQAMILTPICPHTLYSRPLVISPDEEVEISVEAPAAESMLTVDGQQGIKLTSDHCVIVKKAPFSAKLVRLKGRNFFEVLREKLREGRDSAN
ncbi:MAG TPA: NAD(+)/NADH kinase [Clostridia bacterium]|nr:NAD(+)/NADH kinase [Clostridia bacterium]